MANKEVRIIAKLLEAKTELQEEILAFPPKTRVIKTLIQSQIKGIDKAIEIVREELQNNN